MHVTAYGPAEIKNGLSTPKPMSRVAAIRAEVVQELKQVHSNTEKVKKGSARPAPAWMSLPQGCPACRSPGSISRFVAGSRQVVLFRTDFARSAALSPKSGS